MRKFAAESREKVIRFATKSVHVARFTGLRQICFPASNVTALYDVTPA